MRAKRQADARSKVHSDCVRPIGSAANSRPRVLVGGRSFYTASIRCCAKCAPPRTLAVRTLPGSNFLSIAARVIPVSRENDRFVSLVTLCFVGAAFFVLLAPAFMRPRFIALRMPFVIRVFPLPQFFAVVGKVRFLLFVERGFILLVINFSVCSDLRSVASATSSGDCICSFRVTSSPRPHPLGVLSSSLFDSHLQLFTIVHNYFALRASNCASFALHTAMTK